MCLPHPSVEKEVSMEIIFRKEDGMTEGATITIEEFMEDIGDAFEDPGIVAENLLLNEGASVSVGTRVYYAA